MARYRAIPQGFMTVGEMAKKMGVTVRTLQYYDKEGLLSPSAESEGGRRLYTDKDLVALHQIISLKSLGFSLDDIKQRLISLETPTDVANALTEQADDIRQKIEQLKASLSARQKFYKCRRSTLTSMQILLSIYKWRMTFIILLSVSIMIRLIIYAVNLIRKAAWILWTDLTV